MENPDQERRQKLAASWIDFWPWICVLLLGGERKGQGDAG
jgi:hypothetical protein